MIGRLRSHLGVTLSPFWARGNFGDFSDEPVVTTDPAAVRKADDSLIITRAFSAGRHRSHRMKSLRNREILLAIAGGVLSLILLGLVIAAIKLAT